MSMHRRNWFSHVTTTLGASALAVGARPGQAGQSATDLGRPEFRATGWRQRFAVSTYSFWRYRKGEKLPIEKCIDLAAEMGFDGVEILHVQMSEEEQENSHLQRLKPRGIHC